MPKNKKSEKEKLLGIPTNIITGFLGAGKTSSILELLKSKPSQERWAVLVNEFGEIGIDGALITGQHGEQQGVYIREVPGGCMCCTAGLSMQVALTQLLSRAKPDRLLIEPTGLGHPKEVLMTLSTETFKDVISVQKTVTLVDARQLSDKRYAEHETFRQQIAIADVIVGNKQDLYTDHDKTALKTYLEQHAAKDAQLIFTEYGKLQLSVLAGISSYHLSNPVDSRFQASQGEILPDDEIPECGFVRAVNQARGFVSMGWRFAANKVFDRHKLFALLSGVNAERLKAAFITNQGCYGYNLTRGALTEMPLEQCDESRIEIIDDQISEHFETALFDCLLDNGHLPESS